MVSQLVLQADVVGLGRRVGRRHMATVAAVPREDGPSTFSRLSA